MLRWDRGVLGLDAAPPGRKQRRSKTQMDSHEKDRLYRQGLEAFNSSRFFEAHELWEDAWRETQGPDKPFLQGLIQVAAAFHHNSRGNLAGTRKLLQAGLLKLDAFPAVHGELEIAPLRDAVRAWLAAIAEGHVPAEMNPPRIGHRFGEKRSAADSHAAALKKARE
jgi:predicted metal-dependent hydrolase